MTIPRLYKPVIEHPDEPGFYKHPMLPIWLSKTDDRVLTPSGFVEPSVGGEYKYYIRQHIHVLKLETFLVKPDDIKVIGNHRNGKKHDNLLGNLEWTTYSGNIKHAYDNGLRSDNLRGFLKDLETGDIVMFNTLRECAEVIGTTPPAINRYFSKPREYPIRFKFCTWLIGEKPSNLTKEDIGMTRKCSDVQLIATNEVTGEVKHFGIIQSFRKFFGCSVRTTAKAIKKGVLGDWIITKPKTYKEYVTCLEVDENFKSTNKMKAGNRAVLAP